jgi:rfaE bifunctional protein kinase chain/domain
MNIKRVDKILMNFNEGRVLVIGDVILDEFMYGEAERISPEAPVPVVDVRRQSVHLGGAANVVRNLHALGAKAALCGVVGNDDAGNRIMRLLHDMNVPTEGTVVEVGRPTSIKTRIIAAHQQVVRFDREDRSALMPTARDKLRNFIRRAQKNFNAVIVSDYGKGVISEPFMETILQAGRAQNIPVIVDPLPHHFPIYTGCSAVTPNLKEAGLALGRPMATKEDIETGGEELRETLHADMVLITRGEQGMTLFEQGEAPRHIPTRARQVFDVTGAGDTVIAAFTLALVAGAKTTEAAEVANHAAGIVVGKLGTATADVQELRQALREREKEKDTKDERKAYT